MESNERSTALTVIMDCFSKRTKTVFFRTTTAQKIAAAFTKHCVFLHCPPGKLLAHNRKQLSSRFSREVCHILGVARLYTMTYHPSTSGQSKRFSRILSATISMMPPSTRTLGMSLQTRSRMRTVLNHTVVITSVPSNSYWYAHHRHLLWRRASQSCVMIPRDSGIGNGNNDWQYQLILLTWNFERLKVNSRSTSLHASGVLQ